MEWACAVVVPVSGVVEHQLNFRQLFVAWRWTQATTPLLRVKAIYPRGRLHHNFDLRNLEGRTQDRKWRTDMGHHC
jgi:hypothetical protein